jgi:hypothetical protein
VAKGRFRKHGFPLNSGTIAYATTPKNYREYDRLPPAKINARPVPFSAGPAVMRGYFFSITHCNGC